MKHRRTRRAEFVCAVTEVLFARGLPEEIIDMILRVRSYAADIIRCAGVDMQSKTRDIRMAIRWFAMNMCLSDPLVVRSRRWHWTHKDVHLTALEELFIHTRWQVAACPVFPYRFAIPAQQVGMAGAAGSGGKSSEFVSVLYQSAAGFSPSERWRSIIHSSHERYDAQ